MDTKLVKKKADLHVFTDILAGTYFNNIYTFLRLTVIAEIFDYINCIAARAFSKSKRRTY